MQQFFVIDLIDLNLIRFHESHEISEFPKNLFLYLFIKLLIPTFAFIEIL